jgi:hypothetical protein
MLNTANVVVVICVRFFLLWCLKEACPRYSGRNRVNAPSRIKALFGNEINQEPDDLLICCFFLQLIDAFGFIVNKFQPCNFDVFSLGAFSLNNFRSFSCFLR